MLKFRHSAIAAALSFTALTPLPVAAYEMASESVAPVSGAVKLDEQAVNQLFIDALKRDKTIGPTVERLESEAGNAALPAVARAEAALAAAHLNWRYGRQEAALTAVDRSIGLTGSYENWILKARILDSMGKPSEAAEWYRRADAAAPTAEDREFIRIRLTMIDVNEESAQTLVNLAGERDQGFQNRAAVALAVLGFQKEATGLYRVEGDADKPFQQHIRLADWAIKGGDFKLAQAHAWQAYETSVARYDANYALAVLAESYREADNLAGILELLDANTDQYPDLRQLRFDVLVELNRYDEAITHFKAVVNGDFDVEKRQQLIKLYEAAGRMDDMEAEYEKLISEDSGQVAWYAGLAAHYMNVGSPDQARRVWSRLEKNNTDNMATLVAGAETMLQMGMQDEALEMVKRHQDGEPAQALFFVFEANRQAGQDEAAAAALEELVEVLPERSGYLRDVADAWERLNRPEKALAIFQRLDQDGEGLGYDERMRLAWLYSITDQKEKALEIWKDIWVSVQSPARRSFAEAQLMLLSAELNKLADIVVDIEEKLQLGEAKQNDVDLLVRIYVEVGDQLSAVEVTEEYARRSQMNEVDRLYQVGRIYMRLTDYRQYDGILRQLVEVDTENRVEHIRNIIMNLLSHDLATDSKERFEEIEHWLGELKAYDKESVTGEFEAGILSMGGFNDQAIESYRLALAEYPEHSDNLLLMSDLMKNAGRRDEAVALLQYVAEHAQGDNEFVVAVDGIINMIGARRFGEELTPEIQNIFRWTQRIILERVTGREDKFYLYTLLSDIAEETMDHEGQFSAIENSLSQAGIRRSSILRELITLATAGFNPGAGGTRLGDEGRKLTYGRRLVGLKQELPPEIYIDLGKAMLEKGDVLGAEKAFDMITDITGLIDIDKTKADAFLTAGYLDQALISYNKALAANQGDLELLKKTGLLREQNEQNDIASNWYMQALEGLLRSQPAKLKDGRSGSSASAGQVRAFGPKVDTSVTREYRNFYEGLAQGLIINWPEDKAGEDAHIARIKRLFDTELASVASQVAKGEKLATWSRLDHLAQFARRISIATGAIDLGRHVESGLLKHFADDKDYISSVLGVWHSNGSGALVKAVEKAAGEKDPVFATRPRLTSPLARGQALAERAGDVESTLQFMVMDGKSDLEPVFRKLLSEGKVEEALARGKAMLDAVGFRRVISAGMQAFKPEVVIGMIAANPEGLIAIEQEIGRNLLDDDALVQGILKFDARRNPAIAWRAPQNFWTYLKGRLTQDQLLDFVEAEATKPVPEFGGSSVTPMLQDLLKQELSQGAHDRLKAVVSLQLTKTDLKSEFNFGPAISNVLLFDAHEGNRDILLQSAAFLEQKSTMPLGLDKILRHVWAGENLRAFEAVLELKKGLGDASYTVNRIFQNSFLEEQQDLIDQLLAGQALDPVLARDIYQVKYANFGWRTPSTAKLQEQEALLARLVKLYPADQGYQVDQVENWLKLGNRHDAVNALAALYDKTPGDEMLRASLYFIYVEEERFQDALAIIGDGRADLRHEAGRKPLDDALARSRGGGSAQMRILRTLYTPPANQGPSFGGENTALFKRQAADLMRAVIAADEAKSASYLRGLWRATLGKANAENGEIFRAVSHAAALNLDLDPDAEISTWRSPASAAHERIVTLDGLVEYDDHQRETPKLFDEMAKMSFLAGELDLFLRALGEEERSGLHEIYQLIAASAATTGSLESMASALTARDSLGAHDLTLLLTLVEEGDLAINDRDARRISGRIAGFASPDAFQSLNIARFMARTGNADAAADYYRLLATKLVNHREFERGFFGGIRQSGPFTDLARLSREIADRLPAAVAEATVTDMLKIAGRMDGSLEAAELHRALSLNALASVADAAKVEQIAADISSVGDMAEGELTITRLTMMIQQVGVRVAAGDQAGALHLLEQIVMRREAVPAESGADGFDPGSYEIQRIVTSLKGLYGLPLPTSEFGEPEAGLGGTVILARESVFAPEGNDAWLTFAAGSIPAWMERDDLDTDLVLETAFLLAFQMNKAGLTVEAQQLTQDLAARMSDGQGSFALGNWSSLALIATHIDVALPSATSAWMAENRVFSVDQEAATLRGLGESLSPQEALRAGLAMSGDSRKLSVVQELVRLAGKARDQEAMASLSPALREGMRAKQALESGGPADSAGDEQAAAMPSPDEMAKKMLARFDGDKDGKVTRAEYESSIKTQMAKAGREVDEERLKQGFDRMDADGDGTITLSDLKQAMAARPGNN